MIRNFVELDWRRQSKSTPPGLEIAEFMQAALSPTMYPVIPLLEWKDHGWEFAGWLGKVRLLVVVQKKGRWLVTIEPLHGLFGWRRGRDIGSALLRACQLVHSALGNDSAFSGMRWYAPDEYERRFRGSADGRTVGSSMPGEAEEDRAGE